MASNVTVQPPLHSRRVEAWIHTILNPLIEGLRREVDLLEKSDLSWRWYSKKCEYIQTIAEYIDNAQRPNLEDFLADNPGFRERFEEHDRALTAAESSATRFFDGLVRSSIFQEQVKETLRQYDSTVGSKPEYSSLDSMGEDLPKYIAEYLINRTEVLPHHYMTHKFWENYGREFEPYHERESFQALDKALGALRELSAKLLRDLEDHRLVLCRTYDIPAAPVL